jgi:septal ring factor EnvC (AmiA/AmiB activator)
VLLTAARFVGRNENQQLLALLAQLAALTDAVTRLRENQDRAAQATAARRAAEQVRLIAAQRASVPPGVPAATATRSRQPDLSYDLGRPGPGPVQGAPDIRRGPRR